MSIKNIQEAAQKIHIGKIHAYDPVRAGYDNSGRKSNTAPCLALVTPIAFSVMNGQVMAVYEWMISDPICPGIEYNVDYCVADCLFKSSDGYGFMKDQPVHNADVAAINFKLWRTEEELNGPLPRKTEEVLRDAALIFGDGDEGNAAQVAAMFSALKGVEFSAVDALDFMVCAELASAQKANASPDTRSSLTQYAAMSAAEMENVIYGSGPSQIDVDDVIVQGNGWSIKKSSLVHAEKDRDGNLPSYYQFDVPFYIAPTFSQFDAMCIAAGNNNASVAICINGEAQFIDGNGNIIHRCYVV